LLHTQESGAVPLRPLLDTASRRGNLFLPLNQDSLAPGREQRRTNTPVAFSAIRAAPRADRGKGDLDDEED